MKKDNQNTMLKMFKRGFIFTDAVKGEVYRTRVGSYFMKKPKLVKGHIGVKGYLQSGFNLDGLFIKVYLHQIIILSVYGKIPMGFEIDHKNNNKIDNRISNLQLLTPKQNVRKAMKDGIWRRWQRN